MVIIDPADDTLAAENEYSSGFVMAITEFKISGVNGVEPAVLIVPTLKFDALVAVVAVGGGGATLAICDDVVVIISTFTIGIPFILSLKL